MYFFRSFCGNGKFYFRWNFAAFTSSFPRKRESIFTDKFPHSPLFAKKMCGDSKLNFRVKFAENSKINRPEWIPAFAGMTAFFSRNSFAFAGMECTFSGRFAGMENFIFGGISPRSPRHSRESGNPFLPTNFRIHLFLQKKCAGILNLIFA